MKTLWYLLGGFLCELLIVVAVPLMQLACEHSKSDEDLSAIYYGGGTALVIVLLAVPAFFMAAADELKKEGEDS